MADTGTERPKNSSNRPRRVIETHVHYWDHSIPVLSWPFLLPGNKWGYDAIDAPSYLPSDFRNDIGTTNVTRIVHEQCSAVSDALIETEFVANVLPSPDALVAGCSLAAEDSADVIESHAGYPLFRGVRDAAATNNILSSRSFSEGLRALAAHHGTCELLVGHADFRLVSRVAEAHPDVTFVLGHAGSPSERSNEYLRVWSRELHELARQENVVCKVSGLTGRDPGWTVASLRPWVLSCIEAFGPQRTMFGGNWPPARLRGNYTEIVQAHAAVLGSHSLDDQDWFFARTAERVFRLDPDDQTDAVHSDT